MSEKFNFDQFDDAPEEFDFDQFEDDTTEVAASEPAPEGGSGLSQGMAGFDAFTQGLSFGFGDELAGGMEAVGQAVGVKGLGGELGEQEFQTPAGLDKEKLMEAYRTQRDRWRERFAEGEEKFPATTTAADVAGGLVMPGGVLAGAGKAALKAGGKQAAKQVLKSQTRKAAAAGAGMGALEAAGRTEDDITTMEGLMDVGMGAGAGGMFGGALSKIGQKFSSKALQKASDQASREANVAALKAVGARSKDMAEEFSLKTRGSATMADARGAGQELIDEGILKAKQGVDELKGSLVKKMDEVANQRINPAAKKLDDKARGIEIYNFADDFDGFMKKVNDDVDKVIDGEAYAKASDKALYKDMQSAVEKLGEDVDNALNSPNKIQELVNLKRKIQSQVNWKDPQASAYNEFLVKMQSNVSEMINGMSTKIDPVLAEQMNKANRTYGNLSRVNRIVGDELARDLARDNKISLGEWVAAGIISNVADNRLVGPAAVATKRGIEKLTGKDTGKLLNTLEAYQKARTAKTMAKRARTPSMADKARRELAKPTQAARAVAGGSAVIDTEQPAKPYQKNRAMGQYIENATPESIVESADQIRKKHGQAGEILAERLEKIAASDRGARRAMMFTIMQDPNNRKMMGLDKDKD